jgi:hypothetical protein
MVHKFKIIIHYVAYNQLDDINKMWTKHFWKHPAF